MSHKDRNEELRSELERIVDTLQKRVQPEKIVLFGSLASGRLNPQSDIDLLIIQQTRDSIFERVKKLETLLKRRYAADLIVLTPQEVQSLLDSGNRYLKEIISHGKVLYERTS